MLTAKKRPPLFLLSVLSKALADSSKDTEKSLSSLHTPENREREINGDLNTGHIQNSIDIINITTSVEELPHSFKAPAPEPLIYNSGSVS